MAIAYGTSSSLAYGGGRTSSVVPAPAGIVNGDFLMCWLFGGIGSSSAPNATTPPAGWTKFDTDLTLVQTGGAFAGRIELWWKRAASESGSYTWTHSAQSSTAFMQRRSGVKTSGVPFGATSLNNGLATGGPQANAIGTGITTTAANSLLLYLGVDWGDAANSLTPPAGMTERVEQVILYNADEARPTAGATGDRSHLCNSTSNGSPWGVRMVELLEESTATTGTYVKVGGVWKLSDTQVKHQGTWKQAATFVKSGGVWKPAGT